MSSKAEQPKGHRELQGILLDSYTLHQGHRISACQTVVSQDSYTSFYTMCVALSSPDDYSTTIAISKYSAEDPRTELQAEVLIHCFSRILRFLIITPCACIRGEVISCVGHTKLISCSTEHQGNEVVSVGRKKTNYNVISCYYFLALILNLTVLVQTIASVQAINGSLVFQVF